MKKLWVTLTFCISLFTMQTGFAVEKDRYSAEKQSNHFEDRRHKERNKHFLESQQNDKKHRHHQGIRGWQAGTTLPEEYRKSDNQVDYSQHTKLSQPTQYQQWRKVNNQYVLMNVLTNTIIKVVPEKQKSDH